ncbi:hypothetical protein ASE04_09770 [Rhizobium sp. Root708]|uniref:Rha family transcriptional regulator n=1 Tax=Rhizobium sp. Root708 TaxID=1736592 RepID=UPI0006F7D900|nr:Rha family transcriptional regulator [Rhizobium sp. Root708]KRB51808.1 hypothetical protein ASE04_09770 [Rhizobium sp. Root708]
MNMLTSMPETMSSIEIADVVNSNHADVRRSIERLAERGVVTLPPTAEVSNPRSGPKMISVYMVGERESYIVAAQLSPEFTARLVDYWQEHKNSSPALPNFADPVAAARAWADEREARVLAEMTKAQIGSRREATAMNKASQETKKARKLEMELDRSRQYASIKRMSMLHHGQEFNWRFLKQTATEMDIPSIEIFDANYGTVKAYHADVWREAYALEIPAANPPE